MTEDGTFFGPTGAAGRVKAIDALRGFALFGILCANLLLFNYPLFFAPPMSTADPSTTDRVAEWATRTFIEGSFYPVFAFLFGLGFAMTLRKGDRVIPTFRRRLVILLVFGLCHLVFIWFGDILMAYALLGMVLVLFRKRSIRTVGVWIGVLTLITLLAQGLIATGGGGRGSLDPEFVGYLEAQFASYSTTLTANLSFLLFTLALLLIQGGQILALFLLGLLAGRAGLEQLQPSHVLFVKRVFFLTAGVGLPLCSLYGIMLWRGTVPPLLTAVDVSVGSALLGLSYLSGMALLYRRFPTAALWTPLAAVGQMSLSNYLAQSFVMTVLFYPYGFGLAGTVGPAEAIVIAIVLYALQALLSLLWLRVFRYGLAEWLWRSLTYRSVLPIRNAETDPVARARTR